MLARAKPCGTREKRPDFPPGPTLFSGNRARRGTRLSHHGRSRRQRPPRERASLEFVVFRTAIEAETAHSPADGKRAAAISRPRCPSGGNEVRNYGYMTDLLPLFEPEPTLTGNEPGSIPSPMTSSQRHAARALFAKLGIQAAREQFSLVGELIGIRITSVTELDERQAQMLLYRLEARVAAIGRSNTGSAWNDREEPTWIDQM